LRERIEFWLREARSPAMLVELCARYARAAARLATERQAVKAAMAGDLPAVEAALHTEERSLREADRAYWAPLRAELEAWRHGQRSARKSPPS
jgi:hypothetical protein